MELSFGVRDICSQNIYSVYHWIIYFKRINIIINELHLNFKIMIAFRFWSFNSDLYEISALWQKAKKN